MPTLKWSTKYDKCVMCGESKLRHVARGLCEVCYENETRKRHENHIKRDKWRRGISAELTKTKLEEEYSVLGKSLTDIAREYNCTRQYIFKLLKIHNIPQRTKAESRKLAIQRKKIKFEKEVDGQLETVYLDNWTINENFFKSWTPQMAYVLGFIFADGSLSEGKRRHPRSKTTSRCPACTITQDSPEILGKIKALMSCNKRLYKRKNWPKGYLYVLQVDNEEIYEDLLKLGLTPAKSKIVKFPEIPPEYIRHFVRGCWDGDGSVYTIPPSHKGIGTSFVSGSKEFIEKMLSHLEKAGLPERTIYKYKGREAYYFVFKRKDSIKLFHYLYDSVDSSMYLERKYKIFNTAVDYFEREQQKLF